MSPLRFAFVCVLATFLLVPTASAQSPARTISVTGEGSLAAVNDAARLGFSVEGRGATRPVALRNSSANLRRVLAAIKGLGVADRDLRTRGVSVLRRRGPDAVPRTCHAPGPWPKSSRNSPSRAAPSGGRGWISTTANREVVPGLVELEVAVPRLTPALR